MEFIPPLHDDITCSKRVENDKKNVFLFLLHKFKQIKLFCKLSFEYFKYF